MALRSLLRARRKALALPVALLLLAIAEPAFADPNSDVNNAQQQLQQAQAQAKSVDGQLANAQSNLAAANAQLAALRAKIATLDSQISADTAAVDRLNAQLASDPSRLATYLRQSYENGGSEAELLYLMESQDIATAVDRKVQLDHVANAT